MQVSQLYRSNKVDVSFEVFPPKSSEGEAALGRAIGELARYQPGFISCTYGAGGSTRTQTLNICQQILDAKVPCTAHFTCLGGTIDEIRDWLSLATSAGVQNIMALRGDPPKGQSEFTAIKGGFRYANELVGFIKREFPNFGIGVAGYPEKHVEAPNLDVDMDNLKRKVDAGADAVFTQLFYDNADFYRFRDACVKRGITKPIVPGLLPVITTAQVQRITGLCGARIPDSLKRRLEKAGDKAEAQTEAGIEHCAEQYQDLLKQGVAGVHFYVLNRTDVISSILNRVAT